MKEFNAFSISIDSIQGNGSYFIHDNDIYIETGDNNVVKVFKDHLRNKVHLNSIEFTFTETNRKVLHNGPFMIKSIDKKLASGMTTIELLRSSWI